MKIDDWFEKLIELIDDWIDDDWIDENWLNWLTIDLKKMIEKLIDDWLKNWRNFLSW